MTVVLSTLDCCHFKRVFVILWKKCQLFCLIVLSSQRCVMLHHVSILSKCLCTFELLYTHLGCSVAVKVRSRHTACPQRNLCNKPKWWFLESPYWCSVFDDCFQEVVYARQEEHKTNPLGMYCWLLCNRCDTACHEQRIILLWFISLLWHLPCQYAGAAS